MINTPRAGVDHTRNPYEALSCTLNKSEQALQGSQHPVTQNTFGNQPRRPSGAMSSKRLYRRV